jgi:hypothetical protein
MPTVTYAMLQRQNDLSQVSMQGRWKAWLHLRSNRRLSPSRNSPRQTYGGVGVVDEPVAALVLAHGDLVHQRLIHPIGRRDVPRLLAPGIIVATIAALPPPAPEPKTLFRMELKVRQST